jgi:hypothetical protein
MPGRTRTTTGTRPAVPTERPAALFADSVNMEQSTRPSTRVETLVMPKVEVPEQLPMTRGGKPTREMPDPRGGRTATPSETSTQAPEGRTVTQMDTPIGRGGGTRITRMPEAPGGKGQTDEAGETPDIGGKEKGEKGGKEVRTGRGRTKAPEVPPEKDGFRTPPPQTGARPALGQGPVRGPVLPVKELIPGGLEKLPNQEGVAKRFASDAALLHQQLRPSEIPSSDRALRLWAFFSAYAEAAAAHDKTPLGGEVFDKALKEQGFAELRDAHTGEDGLKKAKWVLEAPKPEEARQRAEQVQLEPPPEVLLSEQQQAQPQPEAQQPRKQEEPQKPRQEVKDNVFTQPPPSDRAPLERVDGHPELMRVSPQTAEAPRPVLQPVNPQEKRGLEQMGAELQRMGGSLKKLGGNMLWNTLHLFRNSPEESAVEQEKFSQMAFGAILAFVGLMLLGILLVSL